MGTGFQTAKHLEGLIPRAVRQLFSLLENNQQAHRFNVDVQFLEIYKEKIFDLLSSDGKVTGNFQKQSISFLFFLLSTVKNV